MIRIHKTISEIAKCRKVAFCSFSNVPFGLAFQLIVLAGGLGLLVGSNLSYAQVSGYGTINGTVTEQSGAVVSGASVTVQNSDTGAIRQAVTGSGGEYAATNLQAGHYSVSVSHSGFETTKQSDITLSVSQVAAVNLVLTVGQATETVSVNASQELLETATAALGQVIDNKSITELPLNTRNPGSLTFLVPGAVDGATRGTSTQLSYAGSGIMGEVGASINGGRMGSAYYELDGVPNMDNYVAAANPFPNSDATQEFRVQSNNFSAEYGGGSTAVISVVTKSGTNNWHGDGFLFARDAAFNAPDWFSKQKDGYQRFIYGGSVGGPIQKEKHFIFGNFQQLKSTLQNSGSPSYVPTAAMINNGDFSAANLKQLYYPADFPAYPALGCSATNPNPASSGTPGPCGPHGYGKAITGNNVANDGVDWAKVVDPVALNILKAIPTTTNPTGLAYVPGASVKNTLTEFTIKYDWNPNSKNHVSGRAFFDDQNEPAITSRTNLLATSTSWLARIQNYAANWTYTANSNLLNSAYFGTDRQTAGQLSGIPLGWKDVGSQIPQPDNNITVLWGSFGWTEQNVKQTRYDFKYGDQVSLTAGKHLIVAGVNVMTQYTLEQASWQADPAVQFTGGVTGSNLSDFLLGYLGSFQQGGGEYNLYSGPEVAAFIDDAIKLKPNLTVDLGLRWDPWRAQRPTPAERDVVFSPGGKSSVYVNAPVGLLYIGDHGVPAGQYNDEWGRFMPRIGIAWQPTFSPNTSIRAGVGRFGLPLYSSYYNHLSADPPFSPTFALTPTSLPGQNPAAGQPQARIPVDNPWSVFTPTGGAAPFPPYAFQTGQWNKNPNQAFVEPTDIPAIFTPDFKLATAYNWNLSIQHQFAGNFLFTAAYVGSEAYHITTAGDLNPGVYSAGGQRTRYGTPGQNGCANGCLSGVTAYLHPGTASYEGAQFSFEKRFARGFQFNTNFATGKTMDTTSQSDLATGPVLRNAYDPRIDRGISSLNVPYVWNNFGTWQLPAFKGHGALANGLLGNWEFSGIYTLVAGPPFTVGTSVQGSLDQQGNDRADRVTAVAVNVHKGSQKQWLAHYYNTAAFTENAPGTYGDAPKNAWRGPREDNIDSSVAKNFPFHQEQYRLQFRWEMYNALNHPWFSGPGNACSGCSNEGQITSLIGAGTVANGGQSGLPRVMQFALKFYW